MLKITQNISSITLLADVSFVTVRRFSKHLQLHTLGSLICEVPNVSMSESLCVCVCVCIKQLHMKASTKHQSHEHMYIHWSLLFDFTFNLADCQLLHTDVFVCVCVCVGSVEVFDIRGVFKISINITVAHMHYWFKPQALLFCISINLWHITTHYILTTVLGTLATSWQPPVYVFILVLHKEKLPWRNRQILNWCLCWWEVLGSFIVFASSFTAVWDITSVFYGCVLTPRSLCAYEYAALSSRTFSSRQTETNIFRWWYKRRTDRLSFCVKNNRCVLRWQEWSSTSCCLIAVPFI